MGKLKSGRERWDGGYIHRQKDGRPLFIIERQVGQHRFHVSTRTHIATAAYEQLKRFEADPFSYSPAGSAGTEPLWMTEEIVMRYRDWMLKEKQNTRRHANQMANRLADWMEDLGSLDLRKVTLKDHLGPIVARRKTCRPARIIAIKGFYAWLRKTEHLLTSSVDPTLDLPVPQAQPEKNRRRKVLDRKQVRKAFQKLKGAHRDCLLLLTATGWHVTELERFVRRPDSEIVPQPKRSKTLATLVTLHKGGEKTRTPLQREEHLACAKRLRERGTVPRKLNAVMKAAAIAANVAPFTLGVMRHSVATWAHEGGASLADIAEFLGHKDARTTRRFYADVAAPTKTVPTIRLA